MAEPDQLALLLERRETALPAPGHVLEEHPLDGILGAEAEDLARGRVGEFRAHARNSKPPIRKRAFARPEAVGFGACRST